MPRRTSPLLLAAFTACIAVPGLNAATVQAFPLSDVRLLDGPFKHAQETDLAYIKALDPDRLLAPFRREAGLQQKAKSYGNWESDGLDGHIGGHYLSALSLMYEATGDAECKRRLDYMVSELAACQQAFGDGYVGGIPGSKKFWAEFVKDSDPGKKIKAKWVPWYNLHKTYAGLRDAWIIADNQQAKEVLLKFCDWAVATTSQLNPQQWEAMLDTEYGGMNDVLAEVGQLTKRPAYIELAKKFSHRWLLESLAAHKDQLTRKHANTQIPKVIGYERVAQTDSAPTFHTAAEFFWETVVQRRTVAIGGNSVNEHFHQLDNFTQILTDRAGPETCNTYNMIKLSELLYAHSGNVRYADYIERAIFNHILSSQHPEHGGFVYFTPLRPEHYRVYSQVDQGMWCCVGTGLENHGKYGELIYGHEQGTTLYVNQFIASTLTWTDAKVSVRQDTTFPDQESTALTITTTAPKAFALKLRHPTWVAAGPLRLTLNGKPLSVTSQPGSYATIQRTWANGDRLEVALPMTTRAEPLPAKPDYLAMVRGPMVLAAATGTDQVTGLRGDAGRWGHVATGPLVPLENTPMLVGAPDTIAAALKPVDGKPMTFTLADAIAPDARKNLVLQPFFRIHDTRYVVYWRHTTDAAAVAAENKAAQQAEAETLALDRVTLDRVTAGEQQPETDHNFRGDNTNTGNFQNRPWRDSRSSFSYDLKAEAGKPVFVHLVTWGGDRRSYDVTVNGTRLATFTADGQQKRFVNTVWPVPADLVAKAKGVYTITFTAPPKGVAGGIFEVRLLSAKP